jgi:hypothetical protein
VPSTSLRRRGRPTPDADLRPALLPFAAVFAGLAAAEDLFFGWLIWDADPRFSLYVAVPLALAVASAAGAVLLLRGRWHGWLITAVAAALLVLLVLALVVLFGLLGAGGQMWTALLLLLGPLGSLVLSLRRPIRQWRGNRSPGGRRGTGGSR